MFSSISDQQKISLGRVRQAYELTTNEVEELIQALWPNAVYIKSDPYRGLVKVLPAHRYDPMATVLESKDIARLFTALSG